MSADALKSLPIPTLDHPFGIELWPIFEKVWMQFRNFPPQNFRFVPGSTPMSTKEETLTALVAYYVIVFGGRELMKKREKGFTLNGLFMAHNLFLTLFSASLLVLFTEQLLPTVVRKGIFYAICDADGGWTRRLVVLYYVGILCYSGFVSLMGLVELYHQVH